ncbi:uncharacterized protein B0T23DRAFT_359981 [Neurospora hispaniola]|uniref:Uncharacterized protein n=1 Tax=Neurospora hispaniola TaxID=588809 RepID=A0AAJ0I5K4_9PEZI|nr:hypothetical protein B0T23DRAFT_359981 [Neurospora hispaniola]
MAWWPGKDVGSDPKAGAQAHVLSPPHARKRATSSICTFPAAFTKAAHGLATTQLADNHVRLRVGRARSTHSNIKQDTIWVEPYLKKQACLDLLNTVPPGRTIIFVNNKHATDELDDFLFNKRVPGTYSVFTITRRRNSSCRFSRNGLVGSRVVLVELKQKFRRSNNGEVRGPVRFGRKD